MKKYWRIPPRANAAFVACMEDVLEVYVRPYSERLPVVCMDETNKQLIGKVREKLPVEPGQPGRWNTSTCAAASRRSSCKWSP